MRIHMQLPACSHPPHTTNQPVSYHKVVVTARANDIWYMQPLHIPILTYATSVFHHIYGEPCKRLTPNQKTNMGIFGFLCIREIIITEIHMHAFQWMPYILHRTYHWKDSHACYLVIAILNIICEKCGWHHFLKLQFSHVRSSTKSTRIHAPQLH